MARFETYTAYDAPEALFSMAMEGEFTARGALNAVFNPMAMTPAERDTIASKLKERSGNNPLSNALVDLATNPMVWLTFITSRWGAQAVGSGLRSVYTTAAEYSPWVAKNGSMLKAMGMLTPKQILGDVASSQVMDDVADTIIKMHAEEAKVLGAPAEALMRKLGVDTLDWTQVRDPRKALEVRRVTTAIMGSLEGWDRQVVAKVGGGQETVSRLVPVNLDEVLGAVGKEAVAVRDGLRTAFKQRAIRVFGVDTPENLRDLRFEADPTKITAMHIHAKRGLLNEGLPKDVREMLLESIDGDGDLLEALQAGTLTREGFEAAVKRVAEQRMVGDYFPRNLRMALVKDQTGKWVATREGEAAARLTGAMRPSASAQVRRTPIADYSPEHWAFVAETFGDTGEIAKKVQGYGDLTSGPKIFYEMNLDRGVRRYMNDTAGTYALFGAQVSDAAMLTQKAHFEKLRARGLVPEGQGVRFEKPLGGGEGVDVRTPFVDALDQAPAGRWTNADALYQDFVMAGDSYTKTMMGHYLIPAMLGTNRPSSLVGKATFLQGKRGLRAVLEGPTGDMLRNLGPEGRKLVDGMMDWTEPTRGLRDAEDTAHWLARYFYTTHQGLNPGSMALNLTQPLIMGAPQMGFRNVLRGYQDSLRSMVGYGVDRMKEGFRTLTDAEKMARVEKWFPLTSFKDEAGVSHNLLGIGPNPFETADGVSFGRTLADVTKTRWQKFTDFMMKGFEKTEWINRNTMAVAVVRRHSELGTDMGSKLGRAVMMRDVKRGVQETQFSSSMGNTPLMFQSKDPGLGGPLGGLLSNPLGRQYLPFMLRSTVGQFAVSPRLADSVRTWGITGVQTTGFGAAVVHDFARAMGISAIVYEVGKNLLGADLSRGLALSATTDLFGWSDAARGDSPLWTPPVVDIPLSLMTAVASDDLELIKQTLPRLIPGGVSAAKVLGVSPDITGLPRVLDLQKTYAGWSTPNEEGLVPLFRGDGTLIGYEDPKDLILRGLGVDMGAFAKTGQFDRFVQKNTEEIREYRRRAIRALLNGDMGQYEGLREQFQTRFKVPLVITREQLDDAIKLRQVPRGERMMDRMDPAVREQFIAMAMQSDPGRFGGVDLQQGPTVARRGERPQSVSPQAVAFAERVIGSAEMGPASSPKGSGGGFTGFSGYEGY